MLGGLSENETTALLLGVAFGFFANVVASLVIGPVATFFGNFQLVRVLGYLRQLLPGAEFTGNWTQEWKVESGHYPKSNTSSLRLYKCWDRVAGVFQVTTSAGVTTHFRLLGVYKGNRLTGWWQDGAKHGYFGGFQLSQPPSHGPFVGVWCGYSFAEGKVKSGDWVWSRK